MKLKNRIRSFLYGSNFFRRLFISEMSQQDIQSMNMLSSLLPDNTYIPITSYSLSPTVIVHILNEIILLKKKIIVEFGSGLSTLFIAKLISNNNLDATLFSIDHDENWQNTLRKSLDLHGVIGNVNLIYAGIEQVSTSFTGNQCLWYSKSILMDALPEEIDLVIVDGPSYSTGEYSRYCAVPFLKDRLSDNYSIFIDDVFRKGENEILRKWKEILKLNPVDYVRYAVFTTNNRVSTVPISLSYNYKYNELVKIAKDYD